MAAAIPSEPALLRIGTVVSDPLRVEGLISILSDLAELVPMTPTDAVRDPGLAMVLIDADDQLFALMNAFRRARASLRLLVLGESNDPKYIGKVVTAGAKGYLSQWSGPEEIRMAISVVADGSIWAPRKVLASLIETYSPDEPRRPEVRFTQREKDVLQHLVAGRSDRETAAELGISHRTVQGMVANLMRKVGVNNRVALTVQVLDRFNL